MSKQDWNLLTLQKITILGFYCASIKVCLCCHALFLTNPTLATPSRQTCYRDLNFQYASVEMAMNN